MHGQAPARKTYPGQARLQARIRVLLENIEIGEYDEDLAHKKAQIQVLRDLDHQYRALTGFSLLKRLQARVLRFDPSRLVVVE
jgi:hypothetical protein